MCKDQLNKNIQLTNIYTIAMVKFTWQHSHRPIHQSQPGDRHRSHGLPHQDLAQTAAQK